MVNTYLPTLEDEMRRVKRTSEGDGIKMENILSYLMRFGEKEQERAREIEEEKISFRKVQTR